MNPSSNENKASKGVSRRSFLKGGLAVGAVALGGVGLVGCGPSHSNASDDERAESAARAEASLPDATPIDPVAPPEQWNSEYDIVVVGSGGGGLAAAGLAAQQGSSVVLIEKEGSFGGATQHASGWLNIAGGSRQQNEMQYGYPSYPTDMKEFTERVLVEYDRSVDPKLIQKLAGKGGEVADWMEDNGVAWTCAGSFVVPSYVLDGTQNSVLGMQPACETIYNAATSAGAEFMFSTPCTGLVLDGDRVVGVQAKNANGDELYLKGTKAVILCSGGFGMNYDMLQKYIPTGYEGMVCGGPTLSHTGECTRMALGVGADMSGYDSWCMWESMPDDDTKNFNFFYGGEVQLCRNPWLNIDRNGKRYQYYHNATWPASEGGPELIGGTGDWAVVETVMALPDHRGYTLFDSDFETNIFNLHQTALRQPIVPEDKLNPLAENYVSHNWLDDIEPAIEAGQIKRADTIEELAEQLDLEPDVLRGAVNRWNDMCDRGEDDELLYPYPSEWLMKIQKPPYYGAKIGGHFGKTLCGLRVDENLQVVDTKGRPIPGLYANFTTAGGIDGEGSWGGGVHFNTSILGGNALSWVSGYVACESALKQN